MGLASLQTRELPPPSRPIIFRYQPRNRGLTVVYDFIKHMHSEYERAEGCRVGQLRLAFADMNGKRKHSRAMAAPNRAKQTAIVPWDRVKIDK